MLKSPRAPLVSVTCSSDLLRRVQWRKNERHKAAVLPLTNVPEELCLSLQENFASVVSLNVLLDFHNCLWGLRVDSQTWNMLARRPLQYKTRDMIRKKLCNIFSSLADTRRARSECNAIQTFLLIA